MSPPAARHGLFTGHLWTANGSSVNISLCLEGGRSVVEYHPHCLLNEIIFINAPSHMRLSDSLKTRLFTYFNVLVVTVMSSFLK